MKIVSFITCAIFLFICSVNAEDQLNNADPILKKVKNSIRKAFKDIEPEPLFEYPKNSKTLIAKYKCRKYMIHGRSKMGKYNEKAHEEVGPSYEGFRLKIHIQNIGELNQAEVPQTIREPYWKTNLDVTIVEVENKQLYWALSYGNQIDKKLLEKVKYAIAAINTIK